MRPNSSIDPDVLRRALAEGTPHKVLAQRFGVSIWTIQKYAAALEAADPRRVRAARIEQAVRERLGFVSVAELARELGVAETTVREAERRLAGQPPRPRRTKKAPDGPGPKSQQPRGRLGGG